MTTFFPLSVSAYTGEGENIIVDFERRFTEMDSLIFRALKVGVTHADEEEMMAPGWATFPPELAYFPSDDALKRKVSANLSQLNSQTGLEIMGQVYTRIDDQIGLNEEDDGVSVYTAKVQAELRWYIFQSALWKHRGRAEEIRLQGKIDRLQLSKDKVAQLIAEQKELFRLKSDSLLAGVLLHRLANLDLLAGAQTYLLRTENISSDELLKILNDKAEAERLLATIPGDYLAAEDLSRPSGILVSIDSAALFRRVRESQVDMALLAARMELLDQQRRNESYWATVNAAPFIRYSLYTRSDRANSNNIDAGVSFRIPLSFEVNRKKRSLAAERDLLEARGTEQRRQLTDKVYQILLEIDRLNRASVGEFRRMKELKGYLRSRTEGYHNRIGEYSRMARIKEYNTYLLCWEKLIGFQYRRDCYVADLQAFLPDDESILYFCREIPLSEIAR